MRIFGIETSCDETAAAIVTDGTHVESSVIATSRTVFKELGGVIPEEAARRQLQCIIPVVQRAFSDAKRSWKDIDAIAITYGPGLLGSLIVGTTAARTLASLHGLPVICVHHTLGHLTSTWLDAKSSPQFPCLTLSASGGHTDLWYRTSHTTGELLGSTRDDAAGEAFDKGSSLLGLAYPGGPAIAACASEGDASAFRFSAAMREEDTLDFSFSGLKTALRYVIRDLKEPLEMRRADLAASFQHAICEQLVSRVERALDLQPATLEVHVVGGVSANLYLRQMLKKRIRLPVRTPVSLSYCTDNAAMIAAAGFFLAQERPEALLRTLATQASTPLSSAIFRDLSMPAAMPRE